MVFPLIVISVFAVMLAIVYGSYWLFIVRPEDEEQRALQSRLTGGVVPLKRSVRGVVKARERLSAVHSLDAVLGRSQAVAEPIQNLITQAGFSVTVGTVVLLSIFLAVVAGAIIFRTQHSALFAAVCAAFASALPVLYLRRAGRKRLAVIEEQFPEAVDLMARALRAGHALTTALQMAGEEMADPVGAEFKSVFEQQNFGMALPDALKGLAERVPLLDARIFVTALLTQRETGGNLSEVLDNIASVIRERFKVKRQVRVISAHGRITGWVLGMLPIALAIILFIISPEHILTLKDDPIGVQVSVVGIVLQVVGILVIRRIVDVDTDVMTPALLAAMAGVFVLVALASGVGVWTALVRNTPEERRIRALTGAPITADIYRQSAPIATLTHTFDPVLARLSRLVPKSPKDMGRLQRRLTKAGYPQTSAAVYFSLAQLACPVIFGGAILIWRGISDGGWLFAALATAVGYILPGFFIGRQTTKRQKAISNGLPDALDLLTVCVEAGSGLDQAIAKATEELRIAHPALADELRLIGTEIRAGKPRNEAFKNFADRTGVEDVRSLVAMLTQTDRFGTSISQALRTHAETSRTKRRQRAEERAAKVSVKLVFPLALCLFPALYIVCFGPVAIKIYHNFFAP